MQYKQKTIYNPLLRTWNAQFVWVYAKLKFYSVIYVKTLIVKNVLTNNKTKRNARIATLNRKR